MPNESSAHKIVQLERRATAMKLRKEGKTFAEIGADLGITRKAAHQLVKRELDRIKEKLRLDGESVLQLELERLDTVQVAFWSKALAGDYRAADLVLKIMERRSKVQGLDAPSKHEHEHKYQHLSDAELVALADQMGVAVDPELRNSLEGKGS